MDFLEKALGMPVPLKVIVDATVCKAAAEKGTSRQMKYLSKTQCVDLFWLRDAVQNVPLEMTTVKSADNIADILTKPLPGPRTAMLRERMGVRAPGTRTNFLFFVFLVVGIPVFALGGFIPRSDSY